MDGHSREVARRLSRKENRGKIGDNLVTAVPFSATCEGTGISYNLLDLKRSMLQLADEVLVGRCRTGDRDAFAEIVRRYQTLICSIAYSATGNLASSEEIAQETFLAAWGSMDDLREPGRLRHWLCGIVRNLAKNQLRVGGRDMLNQAEAFDSVAVPDRDERDPSAASIAREEVELVDRTLQTLPDQYREPMVLFYREEQSVSRVAELLELSTDTVKQRLSRGRKLLRKEVESVIERGLLQSAPGRAFTVGVLSALPIMTGSAKAATIAVTSAKGIGTVNTAGLGGVAGAILGPIAGALGAYLGYSMSMKAARSDRERAFIRRIAWMAGCLITVLLIAVGTLVVFGSRLVQSNPNALAMAIVAIASLYVLSLTGLILWSNRSIARIRREDGSGEIEPEQTTGIMNDIQQCRIFESKTRLLGLPLVSVQFGGAIGLGDQRAKSAVGWIAIGEKAYGILFASGPLAVGGIAVGAIAIGPLALGGLAIGLFAMAGFAIAYWALGGAAIGWIAFGGVAVGGKAAAGGLAVAKQFALGGVASAAEVNNEATKAFFQDSLFFQLSQFAVQPWGWIVIVLLSLVPTWIAIKKIPTTRSS